MADIKIYGTLKNVTNEPIANAEQIGNLSTVATSGSYNDLDDKPVIPSKTSELNNDSGFINKEDIAPVEEVTKSRNNYDSSAGVISFITGDGEVHYPSVKYGEITFYDYESTVDIVFSNNLISLNEYEFSVRGTTNTSVKSIQIKDGDNVLYTAEQYSPAAAPCFRIKSLIKNSNGTYTAVVTKQPSGNDYGYTTITFTSNTLTIAPVGNPTIMTTSLSEYDGTITYLEHTELNTLHKAAITGSYNDLNDKPTIPTITHIVEHTTEETNIDALTPNVLHKWGTMTSLTISALATSSDETVVNEYMIEFTSGSTATALSLPSSIVWAETPNIEANAIYQISVINNLGIIVKFS